MNVGIPKNRTDPIHNDPLNLPFDKPLNTVALITGACKNLTIYQSPSRFIFLEIVVSNLLGRDRRSVRIIANSVILCLMIWALSVSALAFLDVNIHFPWVIFDSDTIPFHRLQAIRIGVMLTFSYYGLLHLIGKSQEFYPLHFLITYLFYMLLSGLFIFFRRGVLMQEWGVLLFFGVCFIFCYLASRLEAGKYLKYKSSK